MNEENLILKKLKHDVRSMLLNKVMQGSYTSLFIEQHGTQELFNKGFDDDDLSQAVELASQFETLIREGKSLAESLDAICKTKWVNILLEGNI